MTNIEFSGAALKSQIVALVKSHPTGIKTAEIYDEFESPSKATAGQIAGALHVLKKNGQLLQTERGSYRAPQVEEETSLAKLRSKIKDTIQEFDSISISELKKMDEQDVKQYLKIMESLEKLARPKY